MVRNNKIKILYIHDRPSGGAGESLYQMIFKNELWKTVGVVFMSEGFLKKKFDELEPQIKSHYILGAAWLFAAKKKTWLFWPTKLRYFLRHYNFYKAIKNILNKDNINIIHTNTINIIEGGLVGKKNHIPHIVQVRELLDLEYYNYPVKKKWIVKRLEQYSDILIANSERTKKALLKLNVDARKIRVIYNAVSPTDKQLDIRKFLKLPKNSKIVALVGWITPNKMVEDFIEIAKSFEKREDTKFVIIGGYGYDEIYNGKIKKSLQNRSNVIHAGLISNATEYMTSFDILICTCYTESFGRTVAEALINGTPALGVNSCAVKELIIEDKSGFLVDKSDVLAFVKYTKLLLDDEELRKQLGDYGRIDTEKRFGLKTIRNQYLKLYQELIN